MTVKEEIIETKEFKVNVKRKNIKNINLSVSARGVFLSCPFKTPAAFLSKFIAEKESWIKEKLNNFGFYKKAPADGEIILLGEIKKIERKYSLKREVFEEDGKIILMVRKDSEVKDSEFLLNKFIFLKLKKYLELYVSKWERITGLKCSEISIRKMRSRWGSCSYQSGKLRFSYLLKEKSPEDIEYVALHELAHLKERGHKEGFKKLMSRYMPDWKERRKHLNQR